MTERRSLAAIAEDGVFGAAADVAVAALGATSLPILDKNDILCLVLIINDGDVRIRWFWEKR